MSIEADQSGNSLPPVTESQSAAVKPRVHATITRDLAMRIFRGDYPPGTFLPNQDDLSSELGVSRTTVREAVKVLTTKGLLDTKPRAGMRVRPQSNWNMLDSKLLEWHQEAKGRDQSELLRGLSEARYAIEPAAAELAARHATAEDIARLEAAYLRMKASLPDNIDECCSADLEFHAGILIATQNFVFAQLADTMAAALRATFRTTTHLAESHAEALDAHREVFECIRQGDTAGARNAMTGILNISSRELRIGRRI